MWPGVATASGGPRRDAGARVLRPDRTPLAGLYAAGGSGSIWGHLTEHGGGLGDALVFGRMVGPLPRPNKPPGRSPPKCVQSDAERFGGESLSALLNVDALSVAYGGVKAVKDVDLDVPTGKVVGLIGPNGAGKTSTIDALTGYHAPSTGTVTFDGHDITRMRPHLRARQGLVRTFQSVELFDDLTVEENLMVANERMGVLSALRDLLLPVGSHSRDAVDWALDLCGLTDVADRFPTELSHGRRKLVGVARALAQRPRLVLMDEPAAGLDTEESVELGKHLRSLPDEGVTVLLVDHDMGLVLSICDEVVVLDFGEVIARGTPAEIRADEAVISAYLGTHGEREHA
jgi:branched-chain amino acid transport system ATP-binding protein